MKQLNLYIIEKLHLNKDTEVSKKLSYDEVKEITNEFFKGTGLYENERFHSIGNEDGRVIFTVNEEILLGENKGVNNCIEFEKLKKVAFDYCKHLHIICGEHSNNLNIGFNNLCPIREVRVLDIYDKSEEFKDIDLSTEFEKTEISKLMIRVNALQDKTSIKFPNNYINTISFQIVHYDLQEDFDIKNISNANCNELWLNDICLKERDPEDYKELIKNNSKAKHIYVTHTFKDKNHKTDMYEVHERNGEIKFKKLKQQYE